MPTRVTGRLGLGQEALPKGNGSCGASPGLSMNALLRTTTHSLWLCMLTPADSTWCAAMPSPSSTPLTQPQRRLVALATRIHEQSGLGVCAVETFPGTCTLIRREKSIFWEVLSLVRNVSGRAMGDHTTFSARDRPTAQTPSAPLRARRQFASRTAWPSARIRSRLRLGGKRRSTALTLHGSTPPAMGELPVLPYASAVGDASPAEGS